MKRAVVLLTLAAVAVLIDGVAIAATWHIGFGHALYCSLGNATTDGCDASPRSTSGRIAAMAVWLTAIPLVAAAFASLHLDRIEDRLRRHHEAIHARLDAIQQAQHPLKRKAARDPEPGNEERGRR
jgi:hypothetical protein